MCLLFFHLSHNSRHLSNTTWPTLLSAAKYPMVPVIPSVAFYLMPWSSASCLNQSPWSCKKMVDIFQEDLFSASILVMLCVHVYDVLSSFVAHCKVHLLNLLQNLHNAQASLLDLEQHDPLPRAHSKYYFAAWAMQKRLGEIVNKMSHLLFIYSLTNFSKSNLPSE